MEFIKFEDILFRHDIIFNYNLSGSCAYDSPHYLFEVDESIHYKSLLNDNYLDYEKLISTTRQEEHSKDKFLELKNNFNINIIKDNKIEILWSEKLKKYTIQDGCHRLSIIKFKNLDDNGKMPKEWFNIRKS